MPSVTNSWDKFLCPETLQSNLISASLFITCFEVLKDSIIDQPKNFFADNWSVDGSMESSEYRAKVLDLDPRKNPLRASLLWLKQNRVIDEADERSFLEIKEHRNQIAHQLPQLITNADKNVELERLIEIQRLVLKIDRWWIMNVELDTQDEIDPSTVVESEIMSGNSIFISMVVGIATGGFSKELLEQLRADIRSGKKPPERESTGS